jgi:hypothetical protein
MERVPDSPVQAGLSVTREFMTDEILRVIAKSRRSSACPTNPSYTWNPVSSFRFKVSGRESQRLVNAAILTF